MARTFSSSPPATCSLSSSARSTTQRLRHPAERPRGSAIGAFRTFGGAGARSTLNPVPNRDSPPMRHEGAGLGFAIAAYGLWGFLPAYFLLLAPASPFEVVAFRILMSLIFCAILISATRAWRPFWHLARQPRVLGIMAIAGVLIYINWQVFVIAALGGQVVEGSLGYFINPIVTVLLGRDLPARAAAPRTVGSPRPRGRRRRRDLDRLRVVPVDRPHPRLLVRPVRLHQEEGRRAGRRDQRPHPRDGAAASRSRSCS